MDSSSSSPNNNNNHHASTTKTNGFLIHPKLGFEPARSRSRLAMASPANTSEPKIVTGTAGYILEDVPHFTDYIPNLPVRRRFHQSISLLCSKAASSFFDQRSCGPFFLLFCPTFSRTTPMFCRFRKQTTFFLFFFSICRHRKIII